MGSKLSSKVSIVLTIRFKGLRVFKLHIDTDTSISSLCAHNFMGKMRSISEQLRLNCLLFVVSLD